MICVKWEFIRKLHYCLHPLSQRFLSSHGPENKLRIQSLKKLDAGVRNLSVGIRADELRTFLILRACFSQVSECVEDKISVNHAFENLFT